LRDFHRSRVTVLAAAGPDLLIFETLTSLSELHAISDVLEELSLNAWVSFSCDSMEMVAPLQMVSRGLI